MRPLAFALALIALPFAAPARADLLTLSAPPQYTPGTAFAVPIGLAPVSNLGLYNVDVLFQWTGAGALTVDPPTASGTSYVFASAANFLAATDATPNQLRVTLSDFILDPTGPNIVAGVNDRLATLTLTPSLDLGSPVAVTFDRTSLFLDDPSGGSLLTDVALPTATVNPTAAVPAPAGLLCAAIAVGVLGLRRRFAHRA